MAASTATQSFWSFLWWIKHNPFKSIDAMNEDDLDAMSAAFQVENIETITTTDAADYGTITWPKTDIAAPGGVAAVQDTASCEQSHYPEQHRSGG